MKNLKYEIGDTCKTFTIIDIIDKEGQPFYKTRCRCGDERTWCGPLSFEHLFCPICKLKRKIAKYKALEGQFINNLKILKLEGFKYGYALFKAQCICGKEFEVLSGNLKSRKSCGCFKKGKKYRELVKRQPNK